MEKGSVNEPRNKVLITGAAGCVGHFMVSEFLSSGYQVIALDRPHSDIPRHENVSVIEADIATYDFPATIFEDVTTVVHAAAIVDISKKWDELSAVNYFATKKIYDASQSAGVKYFIFFSTGSVYANGKVPYKEDSPVFASNDYVRTKLMSEEYLITRKAPPIVNIIRPSLIYGPRGKVLAAGLATLPSLVSLFGGHTLNLTGGPKSNWVHAKDVARAVVFLAEHPQPHGEIFNVAGDDTIPIGDIFAIGFKTGGVKLHSPTIHLRMSLLKIVLPLVAKDTFFNALNRVAGLIYKIALRKEKINSPIAPRLDKEAMDFGTRDVIFDNSKLKSLGFSYLYPRFEDGWKETYQWYKENRWIP